MPRINGDVCRESICRSTRSRSSNLADHMFKTVDTHHQLKEPDANVQRAMVDTYQLIERMFMNAISPRDEKILRQIFMKSSNEDKV